MIIKSDSTTEEHVKPWISEILKGVYDDQKVSKFDDYPVYEKDIAKRNSNNEQTLKLLDKFYSEAESDKLIVTLILRHYKDVYQGWETNSYPEEVLGLIDSAANEIKTIVKDFKNRYPNAKVIGFAGGTSAKSLILSMHKGVNEFDKVFLFSPLTSKDEFGKLENVLKTNPATKITTIADKEFQLPFTVDKETLKKIVNEW